MIKIMRDKAQTRIQTDAVTSYSSDYDVDYSSNTRTDTVILTLGSAIRKLTYLNKEDRDLDVSDLDKQCGL